MEKNPIEMMTTIEKLIIMGLIWESLSDAQQAAWLQKNHLEYSGE